MRTQKRSTRAPDRPFLRPTYFVGERGRIFDGLLHNTVSATILQAGTKINVVPSQVTVGLDGRLLLGYGPEDLRTELRRLWGAI